VGTFDAVFDRAITGPVRAGTDVIPVDACIGAREVIEPRLAPDGRSLVVAVSDAAGAVLVRHRLGPSTDAAATAARVDPTDPGEVVVANPAPRVGRGFGGGCWCWAAGGRAIVYAAVDGNLWWQDLPDEEAPEGGAASPARKLTDHGPERVAQAPHAGPDDRVVYVLDQCEVWCAGPDGATAVRLDDGGADFCFDPQIAPDGSGALWVAWNVPDMPWDRSRLVRVRFDGAPVPDLVPTHAVQQPRFAPDGTVVCVRDDAGWNNVWWGDRVLVDEPFEHGGPTWGLGQRSFAVSPDGTQVAFTRNEAGFGRLCVAARGADGRLVEVRELGRGVHGQLSWEGERIAALRSGARTPTEVVVHEMPEGARRQVLVGPRHPWDRDALVEPATLQVPTSDGAVVHARWYRADDPVGLICWLHGGPTDQWQVTFLPRIAFWRARGWHVVVPDHRGSTGHGRAYQQALRGRWGELDIADVADVVGHLHASGVSSPADTVLMGGSAGGFTVLGLLRHHPGLVAAAVVAYPVADLADLAERSHRFERHYTRTLVGEPPAPPAVDERARHRSPTWWADRIRTPLLVLHGEDDPVVPVGQSRVLVERIRAAGGDVELVVYPGEGHGFRQPDHQADEFRRVGAFLTRHVAAGAGER